MKSAIDLWVGGILNLLLCRKLELSYYSIACPTVESYSRIIIGESPDSNNVKYVSLNIFYMLTSNLNFLLYILCIFIAEYLNV